MDFRLITDSCCEAIPELYENTDFRRVPLTMTLGNDIFTDDEHLNPQVFLRRMKEYPGRAMSACPSPYTYVQAFAKDKLNLVVTLSSQLSGSYSAAIAGAELAAQEGYAPVIVADSGSASAGEILAALRVKALAEKADTLPEIRDHIEQAARGNQTYFVLENLDQLAKSGRMNRITAKLATVMQIRPIMGSDGEGNIRLFTKVQGTRNAIVKLCGMIGEAIGETAGRTLVISHCKNEESARKLKELVENRYRFERILIAKTGGISSMYAQQGGIILAF